MADVPTRLSTRSISMCVATSIIQRQTFRRFVTPTPLFSPVGGAYDRYIPVETDEEPARENGRRTDKRSMAGFDPARSATRNRCAEAVMEFRLDLSHSKQLIRPFTTIVRPMQEGLAFRSKGSIGVAGGRRGERA